MKYVADVLENVSNTLNPIVIKELRQAVKGRFLVAVLLIFLGIQLLTIGLFLTNDSVSWSFDAGRNIFKTLASMLLVTCLILVPAYTGLRLAMERADGNVDLLFISTLRPRSIIWGKFFAALVFSALLYSVCMPFITLTYLLRGIDLPSIFVMLALNFLVIAVAIQCTILLGCLPANRVFKIILGLGWFLLITGYIPFHIAFTTVIPGVNLLDRGIGSQIGSWRFLAISSGVLIAGVAFIGLLARLATALISPLSANRALPVRTYVIVVWVVTGISAAVWTAVTGNGAPITVWAFVHIILQCIGLFIAVSERESLGQRVRQSIPRTRVLRPLAFLFFSGAGGGVMWSSLMIILTLLFAAVLSSVYTHAWSGNDLEDFMTCMAALGMLSLSYAMVASLIRRRFLANRVAGGYTWLISLVLMGCATTILPLILFLLSGTWDKGWLIGSPIGPIVFSANGDSDLLTESAQLAAVFAVFVSAFNLPWFIKQIINFHPSKQNTASNPPTD